MPHSRAKTQRDGDRTLNEKEPGRCLSSRLFCFLLTGGGCFYCSRAGASKAMVWSNFWFISSLRESSFSSNRLSRPSIIPRRLSITFKLTRSAYRYLSTFKQLTRDKTCLASTDSPKKLLDCT